MKTQSNFNNSMSSIVLDRVERYDASALNCYAFRKDTDEIDGLSIAFGNLVSDFPFMLEDRLFMISESAYIAGMFSEYTWKNTTVQLGLTVASDDFMANKRIRKPNEHLIRKDWDEFKVQWMFYVIWCKTVGNENFRKMLLSIPNDAVIIEDSTLQDGETTPVWGAKNNVQQALSEAYRKELQTNGLSEAAIDSALDEKRLGEWRKQGIFEGKNIMGKILMLCREAVLYDTIPPIDLNLLKSKEMYLIHEELTFDFLPVVMEEDKTPVGEVLLDREEVYDPREVEIWSFDYVYNIVEGFKLDLCNIVSYYPFECKGILWRSSEELYLCGEFSNNTEEHRSIQEELIAAKTPYVSKYSVKGKHRKQVREDLAEFRTQWMLWVVWQKCIGNIEFRHKLLKIPNDVILVEDTSADREGTGRIWGCLNKDLMKSRNQSKRYPIRYNYLPKESNDALQNKYISSDRKIGLFKGQNNIGKIMMICSQCLKNGTKPDIDLKLLESKDIYLFGKKISFID